LVRVGRRLRRIRALALAVLGAGPLLGGAAPRAVTAMPDAQAIARFKSQIGFPAHLPGDAPGRGVVLAWPDPQTLRYFRGGGWATITDAVAVLGPGLVRRNWVLRRGDAAVNLRVVVSSVGNAAARDHLVEMASITMMGEIPFVPTPRRLGDLSVETPEVDPLHRLLWVDRNVCVSLTREFGSDVRPLADELQALIAAQASQDLAPGRPAVDGLELSAATVAVGDTVRASIRAPALAARGLVTAFSDTGRRVQVIEQDGLRATVYATSPGATTLHGTVADGRTLLSSVVAAELTVRAP
jgi:hypothetical protein